MGKSNLVMIRKSAFYVLLLLFIYVTTFNIFITGIFKVPAPLIFLVPLLLFDKIKGTRFEYGYQLLVFFIAAVLYKLIGEADIPGFFAVLITVLCFAVFFNYVIANSLQRITIAIAIFYSLLMLSGLLMFIDHQYSITRLRSLLVASDVLQGPSGIATTIFAFGYQMAALTAFLFSAVILFKKNWLFSLSVMVLALSFIFFGMQRSVLIAFGFVAVMLIVFYYRAKSIVVFCALIAIFLVGQNYIGQFSADKKQQNIFNKNETQSGRNEMRGDLMSENIAVITDYPFGLLFYGKNWNDVVQHNFVYKNGTSVITSHNAYLMFITYLGPLLGMVLLVLLYLKVGKVIGGAFRQIRRKENALLISLSCSFIAISINSFFHNEWLLDGSGPTLFLYFSILQMAKISAQKALVVHK